MIIEERLYKQIGELIRIAREQARINQADLAKLVGLTRTSITNIEAGRQRIQIHTLFNIAYALGISPRLLLPLNESDEVKKAEMIDEQQREQQLDTDELRWVKRVLSLSDKTDDKQ